MNQPIALLTKRQWADGRPVYELPLISAQHGSQTCERPRLPQNHQSNALFFYTPDMSRVAAAVAPGLHTYLSKRGYAKFLGFAKFDQTNGIDTYEWKPEDYQPDPICNCGALGKFIVTHLETCPAYPGPWISPQPSS